MKKVMFAAAVAASMVAFGDITSQNVVGYQSVPAPRGDSMRTPTFKAVAGTTYKISDIKVIGSAGMGEVNIALIDATTGDWSAQYYWFEEGKSTLGTGGWFNEPWGETPVTDANVLTIGQGVFVNSPNNDVELSVSGEVISGAPTASIPVGNSMIGNPTPVDQYYKDMTVTGSAGMADVHLAILDATTGDWTTQLYWFDEDMSTAMGPAGWFYEPWGETRVDSTLKMIPGESAFFTSDTVPATVKFVQVL